MSVAVPGIAEDQSLDDVMLAMDVVDTLLDRGRLVRANAVGREEGQAGQECEKQEESAVHAAPGNSIV